MVAGLTRGLCEEGFDDFLQILGFTGGTLKQLGVVLFDREDFRELRVAVLTDVFVNGHGSFLGLMITVS